MSSTHDFGKIDVHHHFLPPPFRTALLNASPRPGSLIPQWSPGLSEETLQQLGCTAAILSVSTPGPEVFDEEAQTTICREVNEWAAALRDKMPQRFGFFAMIPSLLHTDAALLEIRYALDELRADGVSLFTSYGAGEFYLGHPRFESVWRELDARGAVVHTHPVQCPQKILPHPRIVQPFLDFPSETGRMALNMIVTGAKRRYANCKIILSHGGGTLPTLIHRVSYMWPHHYPDDLTTEEIEQAFQSFYFDTALAGTKNVLDTLFDSVPHEQVLFGSDFPYAPLPSITRMTKELEDYDMSIELRKKISYENARRLFPRLAHGL